MMNRLEGTHELRDLIETRFGRKARVLAFDRGDGEMEFSLYDTFVFRASIDPRTGVFGLGLELAGGRVTKTLLGERFSLNNDEKSIAASLDQAERFCRLSLPDKILEVWDDIES